MENTAPTPFTRVRRMPKRGSYDREVVHAVLDAAPLCHVGHLIDGRPVVIPTLHWRHGESVFWHGSAASRMLRANATGGEVCLTATLLDGWVMARSAFHHSANYRSVMCFGQPRLVDHPAEKLAAMEGFVERMFPGRWATLRPPTIQEIKATSILGMDLSECSAKVRTGMPVDDEEDVGWPVWGGVLPVHMQIGDGEPDDHVKGRFTPAVAAIP